MDDLLDQWSTNFYRKSNVSWHDASDIDIAKSDIYSDLGDFIEDLRKILKNVQRDDMGE